MRQISLTNYFCKGLYLYCLRLRRKFNPLYIKGRLKSISDDLLMCLNRLAGELFGNQFFQRREVIARAQYQAAQDFGRRGFVGKEFE